MSRAPDWREQRNSHFLPRWGPVHRGCQPAERQRRSCCGIGCWSCPPPPATPWAPGVPLEPWSYSVGFWGYTLCLYTMQTTFSSLKALRSPPPLGGVSQFSLDLNRGHSPTCGDPWPSRVFLPNSLVTSQPFLSIPMAAAPRSSSHITGLPALYLSFQNNHDYPQVTTIVNRGQPTAAFTCPPAKAKQKLLMTSKPAPPANIRQKNIDGFHHPFPYHHSPPSPLIITSTSNP